jgi:Flp pilus assembly protein CpaB
MALPLPLPPPGRPARFRTPLFLLGVAMALLAFIAMFAVGILFANRGLSGQQVTTVVAAQDIQAREPLTASMLTVAQVQQSALPPHAIVNLSDLNGATALVNIYKGQTITTNLVVSNPDDIPAAQLAYLPIPQGYVAISIPTGELQGVGGYITPGDYINIIATANSDLFFSRPSRFTTRTVFTDVRVIRVGPPTVAPKQGQMVGVTGSLTVVLSQCDAAYLEWLLANVTLKYVLLNFHDYATDSMSRPDPACPANSAPPVVGPAAVDARWGFTRG